MNGFLRIFAILLLLGVGVAGCQKQPVEELADTVKKSTTDEIDERTDGGSLRSVSWSEIPDELFKDGMIQTWGEALEQSALYYRRIAPEQEFVFGSYKVSAARMHQATLELAELAKSGDRVGLEKLLKEKYRLYRSIGGNSKGNVLVTGYYEPLLHGSTKPSARYFYPLYRLPVDLVNCETGKRICRKERGKGVPYYTRAQIDGAFFAKPEAKKSASPSKETKKSSKGKAAGKTGAKSRPTGPLANRGLELVWVDNAIDAFFLHIQGSGRVQMEDGRLIRVGYAGTNGRAYKGIAQILIDEGKIPHEEMTMPRLRQWLIDHPSDQQRLFFANASYVFFREMAVDAVGNINVPLTRDRSIATDHRLFPKGAPGILYTTLPNMAQDGKTVTGWRAENRFIVNQDTGGAIRGPGRVDLFFGFDEKIEYQAGVMKQNGSKLYFFAPRPDVKPRPVW
ncbi:MAG: MltA domain-containing protein [Magnetococcus sp. YQC-9]